MQHFLCCVMLKSLIFASTSYMECDILLKLENEKPNKTKNEKQMRNAVIKNQKILLLILSALLYSSFIIAQNRVVVKGVVIDASDEPIIGATVTRLSILPRSYY